MVVAAVVVRPARMGPMGFETVRRAARTHLRSPLQTLVLALVYHLLVDRVEEVVGVVRVAPTPRLAHRLHSWAPQALCYPRHLVPMGMADIHPAMVVRVVVVVVQGEEEGVETVVVVAGAMRMHILDHTSIRRGQEPNRVHRPLPA